MSTGTGVIRAITTDWRGDTLAADVASGATALPVFETVDFDEESGGLLMIGTSAPIAYSGVDEEAATVLLAGTAGAAYEAGLPIVLWDPNVPNGGARVVEYLAAVELHDGSGAPDAVLPHELIPTAGVTQLIGASVRIAEDEDGELVVAKVLGREPIVDGTKIVVQGGSFPVLDDDGTTRQVVGQQEDGTYTSIDVNGPPPPAPAAPTATGGAGLLIVSSYGLTADAAPWPLDTARIDIHVGTTAAFTPTPATRLEDFAIDEGGAVTFALDPDTYYVKLVAVNTSGVEGTASAEVSATVTAPSTGAGGQPTYESADAPVGLGMDDVGKLWIDTDTDKLHRWDGDTWEGVLIGPEGTTADVLAGKVVPISAAVELEWAVPNPTEVLSTTAEMKVGWEPIGDFDDEAAEFSWFFNAGPASLILDGGVWYAPYGDIESYVDGGGTTRVRGVNWVLGSDGTKRRLGSFGVTGSAGASTTVRNGLTKIGSTWYVLINYSPSFGSYTTRVTRYDSSWNLLGSWTITGSQATWGMTNDGTNVVIGSGTSSIVTHNPTTGATVSSVLMSGTAAGTIRGFARGTFDFGATRYAVLIDDGSTAKVYTYTTAGAAQAGETFEIKASDYVAAYGLGWDGTRWVTWTQFHGLRRGSTSTSSGQVWASYSWYDSVGGGETAAAPVSTISATVPARHGLLLTGIEPPEVDETTAPDTPRIYAATAASAPALSTLRRVTALPTDTGLGYAAPEWFVAAPFTRTTDAPPTVSTFPEGASGAIASELGGFIVKGDGTGDWPYLRDQIRVETDADYAAIGHNHDGTYAPESLITRVERLERVKKGVEPTGTMVAGTAKTINVTFTGEEFVAAPTVQLTVQAGAGDPLNFGAMLNGDPTATGFSMRVSRSVGTATFDVHWRAEPQD